MPWFESHSTVMADLIRSRGWTHGAEIGVFEAQNLRALLMDCPGLNMIAVDRWQATDGPQRQPGDVAWRAPMDLIESRARYRLEFFSERVTIIKADSCEAAKQVADASLDFVFIDGDHSEEGVIADVEAWAPKVRAGGALTGHDTNLPSVVVGLNRSLRRWRALPGDCWISER